MSQGIFRERLPTGGVFMPPSVEPRHGFHLIEFLAGWFKWINDELAPRCLPANVPDLFATSGARSHVLAEVDRNL